MWTIKIGQTMCKCLLLGALHLIHIRTTLTTTWVLNRILRSHQSQQMTQIVVHGGVRSLYTYHKSNDHDRL